MRIPRDRRVLELSDGSRVTILHRTVQGDVREFFVRATDANGEERTYYQQYRRGYNGPYSSVHESPEDAFEVVRGWIKSYARG